MQKQNNWSDVAETFTCAGVIVLSKEKDKCVIVITPNGKNRGFPKGKVKKNNKVKENMFECAKRELFEESGLQFNQLDFVKDLCLNEMSNKGSISIVYLVAVYTDQKEHDFIYDHEELSFSGWKTIEEAKSILFEERKELLEIALSKVTEKMCEFQKIE